MSVAHRGLQVYGSACPPPIASDWPQHLVSFLPDSHVVAPEQRDAALSQYVLHRSLAIWPPG
eukprot:3128845-Lingulodinium_polyedra.AAC.1